MIMMSKEEILKKHTYAEWLNDAMDEYAKQESIKYADWVIRRLFPIYKGDEIPENAEQLYELYLQNKKAKEKDNAEVL